MALSFRKICRNIILKLSCWYLLNCLRVLLLLLFHLMENAHLVHIWGQLPVCKLMSYVLKCSEAMHICL